MRRSTPRSSECRFTAGCWSFSGAHLPSSLPSPPTPSIRTLEKQVESGSLTIAAEKRALNEITVLKRSRKNVESFGDVQTSIDADKARADALSTQLDDPQLKAVGERFDAIKIELGAIQAEGDVLYAQRNALFEQRRELSAKLDDVWSRKKESSSKYKEAQVRDPGARLVACFYHRTFD